MQVNRNRFRTGPGPALERGLGGCRSLPCGVARSLPRGLARSAYIGARWRVAVIQGGSDRGDHTPAGLHGFGIRGVSELGGASGVRADPGARKERVRRTRQRVA